MRLPVIAIFPALSSLAHADVMLAPLFRDGAVLQRDKPLPVRGSATAREPITVTFAGQSASATTGADGRWKVTFKPLTAFGELLFTLHRQRPHFLTADLP